MSEFTGEIPERVAFIRTSDRSTFRRCRRKFNWSYVHRGNRTSKAAKSPLWMGTGFHFAMEDFHGYKKFPTARTAFEAYVTACRRTKGFALPSDWQEDAETVGGMLDYYTEWLETRDSLQTLHIDGVPQVEVNFQIPLPLDTAWLNSIGYDRAVYTGTIDRVCIDELGRLWPLDYKTAKNIQDAHLETDGQVTAYCWACAQLYNLPVAGFLYQQHKKVVPHPPEFLKSTKMFSVAKLQTTTHTLYRRALINMYGSVENAPGVNVQYLNTLASEESVRADKLIRRDYVNRNENQIISEGQKIIEEAYDLLNPQMSLYPNPTRDCSWDCDFRMACLNMDDGSDWEYEIEANTVNREDEDTSWRNKLQYPEPEPEQLSQLRLRQPRRPR